MIKQQSTADATPFFSQKKILEKILTGGIEVILKNAINEYQRDHGGGIENSDNKTVQTE